MTAARACRHMDLAHVGRHSRRAKTGSSISNLALDRGEPLFVLVAEHHGLPGSNQSGSVGVVSVKSVGCPRSPPVRGDHTPRTVASHR